MAKQIILAQAKMRFIVALFTFLKVFGQLLKLPLHLVSLAVITLRASISLVFSGTCILMVSDTKLALFTRIITTIFIALMASDLPVYSGH